jgi:hypothetical protein
MTDKKGNAIGAGVYIARVYQSRPGTLRLFKIMLHQ